MNDSTPQIDLNDIAAFLAKQEDIVVAYLFGSVARDQATHLSDVDIAVLFVPGLDTEASVERQLELMVALDDLADREVQITILNRAPPLLAYHVIQDGIRLHERSSGERVAFEVSTMKTYFDLKPMIEFHRQTLMKQILEVGLGRKRHHSRTLEAARRLRERLAGTAGR